MTIIALQLGSLTSFWTGDPLSRKTISAPAESVEARERILAASTKLFATKGARGTTIREIADEAGVNSQLLYYYFEDKAGLARAVVDQAGERVHSLLLSAAQRSGTPRERLEAFIVAWVQLILAHAPTIRMLHGVVQETGRDLVPYVRKRASGNAALILKLISDGVAAGEFRSDLDPRFAAASLIGMTHYLAIGGPVLFSALSLDEKSDLGEDLAKHTASLFLTGIDADKPGGRSRRKGSATGSRGTDGTGGARRARGR